MWANAEIANSSWSFKAELSGYHGYFRDFDQPIVGRFQVSRKLGVSWLFVRLQKGNNSYDFNSVRVGIFGILHGVLVMNGLQLNLGIIVIAGLLIAYFLLNILVRKRILNAYYISEERRKLHLRFIWCLPFIAPLIIRNFWAKKTNKGLEVMTKQKRRFDKTNYHENGKGFLG